jgi:hypothetical protein
MLTILSFSAQSFFFQFAIPKLSYTDEDKQNYIFDRVFMGVKIGFSH